jgi:hypothetical protein
MENMLRMVNCDLVCTNGYVLLLLWLKPKSELVAYGVLAGTALAIFIAYKWKK